MNYKIEAKEILDCCIKEDSESSSKALILSILEFSEGAGINLSDVNQLLHDMYWELECPEDEKEVEDPICEISISGILDS